MFHRNCPKCNKEIRYKSFLWRNKAEKKKTLCFSCLRSGKNNPNYGKISVLRGKTWDEFFGKEKSSILKSKNTSPRFAGRKHSQESKDKIGKSVSGELNGFYGKKHTDATINKVRNYTLGQISRGEFKHAKNTNIEIKFLGYLNELNIRYEQYKVCGFWTFDFYLPDYDVYIECDGDYWHSNPLFYGENKKSLNTTQKNNLKNDKAKNTYMRNEKKNFYRFWEYDITNNKDMIIEKIKNIIN